jgi:hypothetical protein
MRGIHFCFDRSQFGRDSVIFVPLKNHRFGIFRRAVLKIPLVLRIMETVSTAACKLIWMVLDQEIQGGRMAPKITLQQRNIKDNESTP